MNFTDFTAGKDDEGRRLDRVLKKVFLQKSISTNVYQILRKNLVKLNNSRAKENTLVHEGDVISLASFLLEDASGTQVVSGAQNVSRGTQNACESQKISGGAKTLAENQRTSRAAEGASGTQNMHIDTQTIFRNEHVWALNKPAGINVQKADKNDFSLADYVNEDWNRKISSSLSFKPGPLHRLDKNTSGIVLFSQSLEGAKWITEKISSHEIKKTYLAVLEGHLEEKELWEDFITKDSVPAHGKTFHTVKALEKSVYEDSKKCISMAEPVLYGSFKGQKITLARIQIKTGRKHQIRAQSALHNHVLLGDSAYGSKNKTPHKSFYLHAKTLEFPKDNPLGLPEKLEAPLPDSFSIFAETWLKNHN